MFAARRIRANVLGWPCSLKGDALMEFTFRLRVRFDKRLVLLVKAALYWLLR